MQSLFLLKGKKVRLALASAFIALAGLLLYGYLTATKERVLIGVMIDNHEDARPYQRGLESAIVVQEQLVEGYITRFLAFFDANDLPDSTGPVRSVRPYFIDGSSPVIPAIFHAGGSPEALEQLGKKSSPQSFNALKLDSFFDYDKVAPAPHHRFITATNITTLLSRIKEPLVPVSPLFPVGSFTSEEAAEVISINYHSPAHNTAYTYNSRTRSYSRESRGQLHPFSPKNILVLETDVGLLGSLGRLNVRMEGSGKALLFRDGGLVKGTWTKAGTQSFFTFSDISGKPFSFRKGQVWMIVLDSLERVSWPLVGVYLERAPSL